MVARADEGFPVFSQVRGARRDHLHIQTATHYRTRRHQPPGNCLRLDEGVGYNYPVEIYPPAWSMLPEFACRPPMGLGGAHMEPVVDMHPTDGPPGCVRLSIRHTSEAGRINEKGVGMPDGYRYWLDPQRDFIAIRWEMIVRDATGQEKVIRVTTEETARSPQGVWYATKIRRNFPDPIGKEKFGDEVYHLYVNFDADLPDSLFEPPTPGRIK